MRPDRQPAPESAERSVDATDAGDASAARDFDHRNDAVDDMFPAVYDELRRLAEAVRRGRQGETLNATALVHEAYMKLVPSVELAWRDRAHFFRLAARAMRQVLADAAAARVAQKRGGGMAAVTLDDSVATQPDLTPDEIVELDRALTELEAENPRQARVIECRFFAGLSLEETAEAVGVSVPSVTRDWRFARAWLSRRMSAQQ